MANRTYTSFQEIDQALEILALEKQLCRIKVARSARISLEALSPANLAADSLGALSGYIRKSGNMQKLLLMLIVKKFLK
jgi:Family of unknown function (DUF6327)